MSAHVTHGSVGEFDALFLENDRLRAVIIPSLGGRVWELEDRLRKRQWIWHRPDVRLQSSRIGDVYDEVWAGGWEELFPNDSPGLFQERNLPDHGEWWMSSWTTVEARNGSPARVTLATESSIVRAHCTKEFSLGAEGATMSVTYRIRSRENRPAHFLFKQHLPVAINSHCRLLLPGGRVEPVDPGFGSFVTAGSFEWPVVQASGHSVDLRRVPPAAAGLRDFIYVRELPEGWCGVEDKRAGASLRMRFDPTVLPYVWLFMTYGGWRDLYTVVLEPCSNMPKDLASAVRAGQSALLPPDHEWMTTVSVTLSGAEGNEV